MEFLSTLNCNCSQEKSSVTTIDRVPLMGQIQINISAFLRQKFDATKYSHEKQNKARIFIWANCKSKIKFYMNFADEFLSQFYKSTMFLFVASLT